MFKAIQLLHTLSMIVTDAKTLISLELAHKTQYTLARSAIDPVIGGPGG
jgi:hypothetical protein